MVPMAFPHWLANMRTRNQAEYVILAVITQLCGLSKGRYGE
jgi:hypothetical protein